MDVVTEIEIDRPRAEVAAFAADPDNATAWYKNIRSVEWESAPPVRVGSRLRFEAEFLGRRLVYTYDVREAAPGERLVMRTARGPFPMETIYTWDDADDGATKMTLQNRGEPSDLLPSPLESWHAPCGGRTADLRRLKALLEA